MAAVVVFVTAVDQTHAPLSQYRVSGTAEVEGAESPVSWEVFVHLTDVAPLVSAACIDAALAAVRTAGFSTSVEPMVLFFNVVMRR